MVKKGDTLIEVALAIGIFSMVAIAVVAVMVGGTSNAQNALETTLAREEIDTQAEALRFIHAAYLADEDTGENQDPYTKLWEKITGNAIQTTDHEIYKAAVSEYNTSSCSDIYKNNNIMQKAFIINPRALYGLTTENVDNAFIKFDTKVFQQTLTYPRIIYNEQSDENDTLVNENKGEEIKYAEGIFVIIAAADDEKNSFYDFYIRTCWYSAGSDTPSAISTVIRLYNPKSIAK